MRNFYGANIIFFCLFMVKEHFALKRVNLVRSIIKIRYSTFCSLSDVHSLNETAWKEFFSFNSFKQIFNVLLALFSHSLSIIMTHYETLWNTLCVRSWIERESISMEIKKTLKKNQTSRQIEKNLKRNRRRTTTRKFKTKLKLWRRTEREDWNSLAFLKELWINNDHKALE